MLTFTIKDLARSGGVDGLFFLVPSCLPKAALFSFRACRYHVASLHRTIRNRFVNLFPTCFCFCPSRDFASLNQFSIENNLDSISANDSQQVQRSFHYGRFRPVTCFFWKLDCNWIVLTWFIYGSVCKLQDTLRKSKVFFFRMITFHFVFF